MGPRAARAALLAGAAVVLLTVVSRFGSLPGDFTTVAGAGLLVTAGALTVAFASAGHDRRTALAGALLGLVPALVLATYLARSDG